MQAQSREDQRKAGSPQCQRTEHRWSAGLQGRKLSNYSYDTWPRSHPSVQIKKVEKSIPIPSYLLKSSRYVNISSRASFIYADENEEAGQVIRSRNKSPYFDYHWKLELESLEYFSLTLFQVALRGAHGLWMHSSFLPTLTQFARPSSPISAILPSHSNSSLLWALGGHIPPPIC